MSIGVLWLPLFGCAESDGIVIDSPTPWTGDFVFGPHAVGFKVSDIERSGSEGPRDITLSVWYPAELDTDASQEMMLADYFRSAIREGQLHETNGLTEYSGLNRPGILI
jgi:hypothetical protein